MPSPMIKMLAVGWMSCTSAAVFPARANFEFWGAGECPRIVSLCRISSFYLFLLIVVPPPRRRGVSIPLCGDSSADLWRPVRAGRAWGSRATSALTCGLD
ncbi:unnamed protein product [Prorocentrum cordatum]|uniref:Secreted protein n=1 Tax=Prorocentrum cordatum TaxID=2364126 RepID=A0ABN9W6W4_9DINO|nr:unnamed protein product [Polarella glacialis]